MDCRFTFQGDVIEAVYLYDEREKGKIAAFEKKYSDWKSQKPADEKTEEYNLWKKRKPGLKAYAGMYTDREGDVCEFQQDIARIANLSAIRLRVRAEPAENRRRRGYLSDSSFLGLYHFAVVLNGRWNSGEWKQACAEGREEEYLMDEGNTERFSRNFQMLSLEYQLSNINQAKAFARYMQELDCFYTDRPVDFDLVEKFSEDDLKKIGPLEHRRWLQEHYEMGWTYGEPEREQRERVRQHKDMIPGWTDEAVPEEQAGQNYSRLDKAEQDKDTEPMECMLAMLRMFDGLRIYRLK